jgi:hypothetical protein
LAKSTRWPNCRRNSLVRRLYQKTLNGNPQWWLFRFGSLWRHRNSEEAGNFAGFSLALKA